MQVVFLKDGSQASLITKTDKGYIVDPHVVYHDYESKEEYTEPSGEVKLVDKVYESAPKEIIQEEYNQILQKVTEQEELLREKQSELTRAKYELSQIERTKTDAAKMIINKKELKNAKRLTIWIKGQIAPRIMDIKSPLKLTISYVISQWGSVEEKCWSESCWSENEERWSGYSEYFDPEYGIKADLTDEEILSITHDRQRKEKFDSYTIDRTIEKWLTPENISKKQESIARLNERNLKIAEDELIKLQEKIIKLKNEVTVS